MSDRYDITPDGDIAVSTRVRLARNLEGIPFPSKMSAAERRELNGRVKAALLEAILPLRKAIKYIDMKSVPKMKSRQWLKGIP